MQSFAILRNLLRIDGWRTLFPLWTDDWWDNRRVAHSSPILAWVGQFDGRAPHTFALFPNVWVLRAPSHSRLMVRPVLRVSVRGES